MGGWAPKPGPWQPRPVMCLECSTPAWTPSPGPWSLLLVVWNAVVPSPGRSCSHCAPQGNGHAGSTLGSGRRLRHVLLQGQPGCRRSGRVCGSHQAHRTCTMSSRPLPSLLASCSTLEGLPRRLFPMWSVCGCLAAIPPASKPQATKPATYGWMFASCTFVVPLKPCEDQPMDCTRTVLGLGSIMRVQCSSETACTSSSAFGASVVKLLPSRGCRSAASVSRADALSLRVTASKL